MSKFLVTGATGFVGHHLCKKLLESGNQVCVMARSPEKAKSLFGDKVSVLEGDLTLLKDPNLKIPECDYVIHLAGVINAKSTKEYSEINYQAVVDLVHSIERQDWRPKRLLFASSLAAAGPSDSFHVESDTPNPIDAYGKAKLSAEKFLQGVSIPTTSFRPAIILGPRDSATLPLYKMAQKGLALQIGCNSQKLSFVDVDDVVDAIIKMSGEKSEDHKTYYISNPKATDSSSLGREIGKTLGKNIVLIRVPKFVLYPAMIISTIFSRILGIQNKLDQKQYKLMVQPAFLCSSESLIRDLGWNPKYDLRSSVTKAVTGYRAVGLLNP